MDSLKSPSTNALSDELIDRHSAVLDEMAWKTMYKGKEGDW